MVAAGTIPAAAQRPAALAALAADASVEATPRAARTDDLRALFAQGSDVFVTHLPGARIEARTAACAAIANAGMNPVPHVAAKEAPSAAVLEADVSALMKAGASAVMLIGGGGDRAGAFADAGALLESGILQNLGVRRLRIAGHPEGHPHVDDGTLERALIHKLSLARAFADDVKIVTQFVFDAAPLVAWLERLRDAGVTVPVRVGLAGPASPATLLAYALRCGVGPSLKTLQSRPSLTARLRRRWRPDALAAAVADVAASRPELGIDGIHLFPFGGLAASGQWLDEVARRAGPRAHPG